MQFVAVVQGSSRPSKPLRRSTSDSSLNSASRQRTESMSSQSISIDFLDSLADDETRAKAKTQTHSQTHTQTRTKAHAQTEKSFVPIQKSPRAQAHTQTSTHTHNHAHTHARSEAQREKDKASRLQLHRNTHTHTPLVTQHTQHSARTEEEEEEESDDTDREVAQLTLSMVKTRKSLPKKKPARKKQTPTHTLPHTDTNISTQHTHEQSERDVSSHDSSRTTQTSHTSQSAFSSLTASNTSHSLTQDERETRRYSLSPCSDVSDSDHELSHHNHHENDNESDGESESERDSSSSGEDAVEEALFSRIFEPCVNQERDVDELLRSWVELVSHSQKTSFKTRNNNTDNSNNKSNNHTNAQNNNNSSTQHALTPYTTPTPHNTYTLASLAELIVSRCANGEFRRYLLQHSLFTRVFLAQSLSRVAKDDALMPALHAIKSLCVAFVDIAVCVASQSALIQDILRLLHYTAPHNSVNNSSNNNNASNNNNSNHANAHTRKHTFPATLFLL